jgi:hypothetical protein
MKLPLTRILPAKSPQCRLLFRREATAQTPVTPAQPGESKTKQHEIRTLSGLPAGFADADAEHGTGEQTGSEE